MQVEDLLTILIGCLGVFVGMAILMGNRWDFGSREKMHLSALVDLESLGDRMRFHRMDQQLTKNNNGGGGAGAGIDDSGRSSGSGANERRALGVVEKSHKVALVVASGKALKKVESAIQKRTEKAKKTEESRSDVVK